MRELLGPAGANRFPAYPGDGEEFLRCATAAAQAASLTGAQRLASVEEQRRLGS